jgi:threonine dehydratase
MTYGGGEIGEAAVMVIERAQARVEIVGVEDGQRSDLRRELKRGENRESDEPSKPVAHG